MEEKPPYQCSECELGAMVVNGELVRFCECDAPVIATMDAVASGKSEVSS